MNSETKADMIVKLDDGERDIIQRMAQDWADRYPAGSPEFAEAMWARALAEGDYAIEAGEAWEPVIDDLAPICTWNDMNLWQYNGDGVVKLTMDEGNEDGPWVQLPDSIRLCRRTTAPQPADPDALICDECNDYLEHPAYCETCFGTMKQAALEGMQQPTREPLWPDKRIDDELDIIYDGLDRGEQMPWRVEPLLQKMRDEYEAERRTAQQPAPTASVPEGVREAIDNLTGTIEYYLGEGYIQSIETESHVQAVRAWLNEQGGGNGGEKNPA